MDRNFVRALPLVLKHEGGFVHHKDDPGGATNRGVTLSTFRRYVKPNGTVADLKAITDEQVAAVYYRHYWAAVQAHKLPSGVDYAVFDFAVNSGPSRAAKYLQAVLGVAVDGIVGPVTLAAAQKADPRDVINRLCDDRLAFLKRLKHWSTFKNGWTRRVSDVRGDALAMVGNPADVIERDVPVPVDRPTVPAEVDDEVRKQTNLWGWLTTGAGGSGAGALAALGADWKSILAFGGLAVGGIVILALVGPHIARSIRRIRDAVEQA